MQSVRATKGNCGDKAIFIPFEISLIVKLSTLGDLTPTYSPQYLLANYQTRFIPSKSTSKRFQLNLLTNPSFLLNCDKIRSPVARPIRHAEVIHVLNVEQVDVRLHQVLAVP